MGLVLLFGTTALAQDYAKVEVLVGYSYMRFNPENSNIVSGFSLNGGGGGVTVFLNNAFGISAEFNGYSSLTKTFTFPATANSPCPAGCTVRADGNLFTYKVGPVLKFRAERHGSGTALPRATKTRAISVTKPESFFGSNDIAEPRPYSTVRRKPQIALQRPEQAAANQFVFQE